MPNGNIKSRKGHAAKGGAKKAGSKGGRGRSAISGRYTTTKYAKKHPRTTIIEGAAKKLANKSTKSVTKKAAKKATKRIARKAAKKSVKKGRK
jgi:hypothetical protein